MKLDKNIKIIRIIGVVGLIFVIIGFIHQFFIYPSMLKKRIKKAIALKEGWPMREIWTKFPFSYETHFYMFNVTNHLEIENGSQPIVDEIGPYVYDVWQEKVKIKDHEEDDSISYSVKRMHRFNELKSNGLSDNDLVIIPEFLRISAGPGFNRYNPAYVFAGSKAIDIIYDNPDSVFIKRPVKDFLFDGLEMRCRGVENYFGRSVCKIFQDLTTKYSLRDEDQYYYTSVWGHFNETFNRDRRLRINRGIKNLEDIGKVIEYEDLTDFDSWNNISYCNGFRGTDGTMVRPFLNKHGKDNLEIVNTIICRSLVYHYDSTVSYDGLQLLRYTTTFGTDIDLRPEETCFCTKPESCVKKPGVLDLLLCTFVPWIGSHPHFYAADKSYVDAVKGVNPDKEKHAMFIDVDSLTGIVVRSYMRIQFNMELLSLKKYRLMKKFPTAMLPMVWVDDIIVLPHELVQRIKKQYKYVHLTFMFQYLMIFCSLVAAVVAAYYEYKYRREIRLNPISVMPTSQQNSLEKTSSKVPTKTEVAVDAPVAN